MAQTFHFAVGHCDFKKGLKAGTQLHPWRVHQKVTANERSLCSVTHGCSNCHSSSHKLLSLLKYLSSPHILSFLRGRGKLHATRHFVFIGFLLLIGMLLCFLCWRKRTQLWTWSRRWESLPWALVCLCCGQTANCSISSTITSSHSTLMLGTTAAFHTSAAH